MKRVLLVILSLLVLTGCTNKVEEDKNEYLSYKSELEDKVEFEESDELDFDSHFSMDRENEEKLVYSLVIENPKVNMYKVKALLIHDYFTEGIFPSVGIFDETVTLEENSEDKIILKGSIGTTKENLDIKFKLYLEYEDENGLKNTIYYEVPEVEEDNGN